MPRRNAWDRPPPPGPPRRVAEIPPLTMELLTAEGLDVTPPTREVPATLTRRQMEDSAWLRMVQMQYSRMYRPMTFNHIDPNPAVRVSDPTRSRPASVTPLADARAYYTADLAEAMVQGIAGMNEMMAATGPGHEDTTAGAGGAGGTITARTGTSTARWLESTHTMSRARFESLYGEMRRAQMRIGDEVVIHTSNLFTRAEKAAQLSQRTSMAKAAVQKPAVEEAPVLTFEQLTEDASITSATAIAFPRLDHVTFLHWLWFHGMGRMEAAERLIDNGVLCEYLIKYFVDLTINSFGLTHRTSVEPNTPFYWYCKLSGTGKKNSALMQALLQNPRDTAYLRSYCRMYQTLAKLERGKNITLPSEWKQWLGLSYIPQTINTSLHNWRLYIQPWAVLHLNADDNSKVDFYQSEEKFLRDIVTTTTIGKALPAIVFPDDARNKVPVAEWDGLIRRASDMHRDIYVAEDVKFLTNAEDIIEAYLTNGTSSCMTKPAEVFSTPVHPVSIYADSPGVAVATLMRGKTMRARTVVFTNPDNAEDKRWIRIYGDDVLRIKLERMGFKQGVMLGAKLRKIPARLLDGTEIPGTYVCPYIDDQLHGGDSGYIYTDNTLDHLLVVDRALGERRMNTTELAKKPQFMSGRPQSGLAGKWANYTRNRDKQFGYEIRGIKYAPPNSVQFNYEHEIQCRTCEHIFTSPTDDLTEHGIYTRYTTNGREAHGTFFCRSCANQYYVPALYIGETIQIPFQNAVRHIVNETLYYVEDENLDHYDLRILNPGIYPQPTHQNIAGGRIGRYHGTAAPRDMVTVISGAPVLIEDTVMSVFNKRVHRASAHIVMETTDDDGSQLRTYMSGLELITAILRSQLYVHNGALVTCPGQSTATLEESMLRMTTGIDPEDETDTNFDVPVPFVDLCCFLWAHIRSRDPDKGTPSDGRVLDLLSHQMTRLLEHTPESTIYELVHQWFNQTLSNKTETLSQRFWKITAFFGTHVPTHTPGNNSAGDLADVRSENEDVRPGA